MRVKQIRSAGGTGIGKRRGNGNTTRVWVTRTEWGACETKRAYEAHTPRAIVVHHTATPRVSEFQGHETLRAIQKFHQEERGWDDIGYHFVIGPNGWIYEGRAPRCVGAHVRRHNEGSVGISLIGNFEPGEDRVPAAAWRSLRCLVRRLRKEFGIPAGRIYGHRDFNSGTACPGEGLYRRLAGLRRGIPR